MKVLKVMMPDGRIHAYRVKVPLAAVQMIDMDSQEFAEKYADDAKPDVQTMFTNEGHLTVRG